MRPVDAINPSRAIGAWARLTAFMAVIAAVVTQATLVRPATAQDGIDPAARAVLEASAEAIRARTGLEYRAEVGGTSSLGQLAPPPRGSATVTLARVAETAGGMAGVVRSVGEGLDSAKPQAPLEAFAVVYGPQRTISMDLAAQRVIDRPQKFATLAGNTANVAQTSIMFDLVAERPYDRPLSRAATMALTGQEVVGGVACDVVKVSYPKRQPGDPKVEAFGLGPGVLATSSTYSIGIEDRLPRRVVHEQNAENLIILTFSTEITGLVIDPPGLTPESLDLPLPPGFLRTTIASATSATRPGRSPASPPNRPDQPAEVAPAQTPAAAPAQPAAPAAPADPPAPPFELVTPNGRTYNLNSQAGRVTVLYFWGTWCPPCAEISPLVSKMIATFRGEPVDVLGVAVRERDAEAPASEIEENGYAFTLAHDPDGPAGSAAARAFRIRRFPSIVVIDQAGRIVATEQHEPDGEAQAFVAAAENAVRGALGPKN